MGLNESLYTILFIVFLHFLAATNRNTDRRRKETARSMGLRHMSPPPTTAHHLRPGILLLCESFPHACCTGKLMVFWKVGIDSRWSRRYSYVHLPTFYISRERGEEVFAYVKRVFSRRKDCQTLGGTADHVFFSFPHLSYIKNPLILSEIWRNDCRKSTMKLFLGCICVILVFCGPFCLAWLRDFACLCYLYVF